MNGKNRTLLLRSLLEDGIQEIYLPAGAKRPGHSAAGPKDAVTPASVKPDAEDQCREAMIRLREQTLACVRCSELAATRRSVVFGAGSLQAELLFVGEAPGRDEDEQGLPFVGAAGQLLTKIIEAIGYTRKQVFICNVLKCRPPANRHPAPEEILNCQSYLKEQIALIRPRMICALGNCAAQTLLGMEKPMSQLRGKFYEYEGIKMACTYHPAYLLRNPEDKKKVWEDMKLIRREIDLMMAREPMF